MKDRFDPDLETFLNLNLIGGNVILAGGSLRHIFFAGDEIADFDIFFLNMHSAEILKLELESLEAKKVFECPRGSLTTYKYNGMKIQLITETIYESMESLIDTFDINACCIAYNGQQLVTTRRAIRDNRRGRVTINRVDFPNATIGRLVKYGKKGFKIPGTTIDAITAKIEADIRAGLDVNRRFYID